MNAFGFEQINPAVHKRGTEEEDEGPETDEREKDENCKESSCIGADLVAELFAAVSVAFCEG